MFRSKEEFIYDRKNWEQEKINIMKWQGVCKEEMQDQAE
jgi:hypothetical protein